MMRALAEFIMRGPLQAGAVAVLGYIIPLLTPAAVALVTLRKGAQEGTIVLFLGLAPALLSLIFGESSSILVWVTFLSLIVIYIPSLVLRFTISLANAVTAGVIVSSLVAGAVVVFAPGVVDAFNETLSQALANREASNDDPIAIAVTAVGVSGIIAYILAFNALIPLLIGRWWQALVYNPGGFGSEYRELRLNVVVSLICFAGSVMLRYQGSEFSWWSNVLALPLLLVAFAVMHSIAKAKNLALPWLIGFYFSAIVFTPIVMCIGFVDTWFDFRRRLKESS
jgi:hypothetical protein